MKKSDELGLLGLARRAGKLVVGAEESRRAIRRGGVRVVVLANDASVGQRAKVVALADAMGIPVVPVTDRATLGQCIGAGLVTAVAVTDKGFGTRLLTGAGQPTEASGKKATWARKEPGSARNKKKRPNGHERLKSHKS